MGAKSDGKNEREPHGREVEEVSEGLGNSRGAQILIHNSNLSMVTGIGNLFTRRIQLSDLVR
jgi:hypothetical protein